MLVKLQTQHPQWVTDKTHSGVSINSFTAASVHSSYKWPEQPLLASGTAPVGYVSCLPWKVACGTPAGVEGRRLAALVALGVCAVS